VGASLEADIQIIPFSSFCQAGSVQQAQQSTHLAEGLNLLYINFAAAR